MHNSANTIVTPPPPLSTLTVLEVKLQWGSDTAARWQLYLYHICSDSTLIRDQGARPLKAFFPLKHNSLKTLKSSGIASRCGLDNSYTAVKDSILEHITGPGIDACTVHNSAHWTVHSEGEPQVKCFTKIIDEQRFSFTEFSLMRWDGALIPKLYKPSRIW